MFIQTNRAKIKDLLSNFSSQSVVGEFMVAPRPLPKENFKFYTAYAAVMCGSKNNKQFEKLKNHRFIEEIEFNKELSNIEYFWRSPKNNI